jgi:prophage maintenance system killer protein
VIKPWDDFCSAEKLNQLHEKGIASFGGISGVRESDCPESTLGSAWSATEYSERKTLKELIFASYVLFYLTKKQCFNDAWTAMSEVLATRDLEIDETQENVVAFVLAIANNELKFDDVIEWITLRVQGIP